MLQYVFGGDYFGQLLYLFLFLLHIFTVNVINNCVTYFVNILKYIIV